MPGNAFTAGVKPGGLTDSTQIRILLCYLIANAPQPVSQEVLEGALLQQALVNYFELAASLAEVERQGLVQRDSAQRYHVLPSGREVADTLQSDVPRSVRECALRAVTLAQQYARNAQQYAAEIVPCEDGFQLQCAIRDLDSEAFRFSIYMPDKQSAARAKEQFIKNGADIYKLMLLALTGKDESLRELLAGIQI